MHVQSSNCEAEFSSIKCEQNRFIKQLPQNDMIQTLCKIDIIIFKLALTSVQNEPYITHSIGNSFFLR